MIRVGTSGWRYAPWRGDFYPQGLPQRRELEYASERFDAVEINGTFYSLQRAALFRRWYDQTPSGFRFAVKGGRFITHMKRLSDVETPLANFFASGVLCLADKLGPFLWQFPPNFRFDPGRLETFFDVLPRDTGSAVGLAERHDSRAKEPGWPRQGPSRRLFHAVEVRHESFETEAFIKLLREHDISLVIADSVEWPHLEDISGDVVYVRLHGSEELYASGYEEDALDFWAERVRAWEEGRQPEAARTVSHRKPARKKRDVYVFFDNDRKVRAPWDAQGLIRRLP